MNIKTVIQSHSNNKYLRYCEFCHLPIALSYDTNLNTFKLIYPPIYHQIHWFRVKKMFTKYRN
jgi:hypothetical protein